MSAWVKTALATVQIHLPRTSPLSKLEKGAKEGRAWWSLTCGPGVGSGQTGVHCPSPGLKSVR